MTDGMNPHNGLLFDIQSYSVHDGPGCRTTVFLAGCFLKCLWCSNPESWELRQKVMFSKSKCRYKNGCNRCISACKKQAIAADQNGEIQLEREKCRQCTTMECAGVCYSEALKICGKSYTAEELVRILNRDRDFWGRGGGVTFSGGEPFCQKNFLAHMLQKCKEAYIHTAIETTAYVNTQDFLSIMPYVDFAFIDVKHMDTIQHKEKTGVGNELILNNIRALVKGGWSGRLVLRIPVIQEFNDEIENIDAIADFMDTLGLYEINILPFHNLGDSKWDQLGLGQKYIYKKYKATPNEKMEEIQSIFLNRRIACYIGSQLDLFCV